MAISLISRATANESSQGVDAFLCVVVAFVWLVEFSRRAGFLRALDKQLLRIWGPEVLGLVAVLSLALGLRIHGQSSTVEPPSPEEAQAWAEIVKEWPLLITADTLLALQAMLRLLVLSLVVVRAGDVKTLPLAGPTSVLWFFAGFARALVPVFSTVYMLDGPLGGSFPQCCEVAVLPLLLILSWRSSCRWSLAGLLPVVGFAAAAAWRNRLALSEEKIPMADALFILAQILDLLAAFAYLLRTLLMDCSDSLSLTHLIMPAQAALAAYFFVQAFPYNVHHVAVGAPFAVLHIGTTAQLGAYLASASLHVAQWAEV